MQRLLLLKHRLVWIPLALGLIGIVTSLVWMGVLAAPVIRGHSGEMINIWFPRPVVAMFFVGVGAVLFAAMVVLVKKYHPK